MTSYSIVIWPNSVDWWIELNYWRCSIFEAEKRSSYAAWPGNETYVGTNSCCGNTFFGSLG